MSHLAMSHPDPPDLTGQIERLGEFPLTGGGFADVWRGVWNAGSEKREVAIKVLRSHTYKAEEKQKMLKRMRRELRVWQKLDHRNVIPLYGITGGFGSYSSMVSPWMENGNLHNYLERRGDELSRDRRLIILDEIADGLAYLHSFSVVHGDLTPANILMTSEGNPLLIDFGLSQIISDIHSSSYLTSKAGGASRWAAIEFYHMECGMDPPAVSTRSDVYSLGSVAYQILFGKVPYHEVEGDTQVLLKLIKGEKPERPRTILVVDADWDLIYSCWSEPPLSRPDVIKIREIIRQALPLLPTLAEAQPVPSPTTPDPLPIPTPTPKTATPAPEPLPTPTPTPLPAPKPVTPSRHHVSPSFKPIYRTSFEHDPVTCSPSELMQLYHDLLPREPLIGYRSFVGNGAFKLEFDGMNPVRWRSFLNADLPGLVRVETAVDLANCSTIGTPSGAGVLVILPDEVRGDICSDLFFLVEPSVPPALHALKLSKPADEENELTPLHYEPLPHCSGQQIVSLEVTLLNDLITISTNSVPSAWTLSIPTSGGPKRLRAFGLCCIGPGRVAWTSLRISTADPGDLPPPPPDPEPMDLPAVRAIPLQPILFAVVVPSLDAIIARLRLFIDGLPSPSPDALSAKKVFSLRVLPFLKSRFPSPPATPNASVPVPTNLLADWEKATIDLFDVLPPNQLFPLVDLWRVALLDERVSTWCTTKGGTDVIQHMILKVVSIRASENLPRNLLLTTLRLAANCFAFDRLGRYVSSSDSPSPNVLSPRAARTSVLLYALDHIDADTLVRKAAALLAFNEAVLIQKSLVAKYPNGPSARDEDWEAELVCVLVEAIHKENESEDIVHRLIAALALFLHQSPFHMTLIPLTVVLMVKQKLRQKLLKGGCGATGVVKADTRKLIEEVAEEFCA